MYRCLIKKEEKLNTPDVLLNLLWSNIRTKRTAGSKCLQKSETELVFYYSLFIDISTYEKLIYCLVTRKAVLSIMIELEKSLGSILLWLTIRKKLIIGN